MSYDLRKPCLNCPFLREGGIRLRPARVREVAGMMLSSAGGEFPCHKTVKRDDDQVDGPHIPGPGEQHCAGALIFAEKNDNATQMMRIAERIGLYDRDKVMADEAVVASVFDSMEEMLAINRNEQRRGRK